MKPNFEIDVTDPKKLRIAKAHLTRLLEIVDFALSKYESHRNGHGTPDLPLVEELSILDTRPNIAALIDRLPQKFTTSDVILSLGNEGKENRPRAKVVLNQMVALGKLRVLSRGQGRRPTEFEKIDN